MPTRRIFFSRLAVDARIGILEHERSATQPLYIDAKIDVNITRPLDDQDIHSVLDYRSVRETLITTCTHTHFNLIETLIEHLTARLMADFQEICAVRLRISKPLAFTDCDAVGVEIYTPR
jgi:dihydroneopterin aldolase